MARQDTSATWGVTITDVMGIFHDALCSVVPHAERAHMPWRDGKAYDDWDRIARVLFESFVVDALRWGLPEDKGQLLRIPTYDVEVEDYCGWSPLEVIGDDSIGSDVFAFGSLVSGQEPFDTVRAIRLTREPFGRPAGEIRIPFAGTGFCVLVLGANGQVERHAVLEVAL